jgi:hypothetical protein
MLAVSQDHYAMDVVYPPGRFPYDRRKVGTRYAFFIIRTLANPDDPKDIANWFPIVAGWNYTVRLYRPRKAALDGSGKLPGTATDRVT